jgi:hypothetical protein
MVVYVIGVDLDGDGGLVGIDKSKGNTEYEKDIDSTKFKGVWWPFKEDISCVVRDWALK